MEQQSLQQIDVRSGVLEVDIRKDGKVIWVNIDGVTRLRVTSPDKIVFTDRRVEEPPA